MTDFEDDMTRMNTGFMNELSWNWCGNGMSKWWCSESQKIIIRLVLHCEATDSEIKNVLARQWS